MNKMASIFRVLALLMLLVASVSSVAAVGSPPAISQSLEPAVTNGNQGPAVVFDQDDQALCQYEPEQIKVTGKVYLPDGIATATLQTTWRVVNPQGDGFQNEKIYASQPVKNGDTFELEVGWPGIRPGDEVVSVNVGALLLDAETGNPIMDEGASLSFYWYPWVCPPPDAPADQPKDEPPPPPPQDEPPPPPPQDEPPPVPPQDEPPPPQDEPPPPPPQDEPPPEPPKPPPSNGQLELEFTGPVDDTPLCEYQPSDQNVTIHYNVPQGEAILQLTWYVVESNNPDIVVGEAGKIYKSVPVSGEGSVTVNAAFFGLDALWPGILTTDTLVEIHIGANLLDPTTRDSLKGGIGLDFYWYPWVCDPPANITIVKNTGTVNAHWLDFNFTGDLGDFALNGGDDPNTNSTTFISVAPNVPYNVTESKPGNWDLTGLSCDGGAYTTNGATLTVTPAPRDEITCTFTNERRPQIKITKYDDLNINGQWDEGEPGVEGWQMFLYISDGQGGWTQIQPREVRTNASGVANYTSLEPGVDHLVCEEQPEGWANSDPGNQAVMWDGKICQVVSGSNLVYGAVHPVLFGNYRLGKVTIVKDTGTVNAHWLNFGFTGDLGDFALNGGNDPNTNSATFENLAAHTPFSVTENDSPGNWDLTGLTCSPDNAEFETNPQEATVTVTITRSGEHITCTFTNERRPQIKITKYDDLNINGQWDEGEPGVEGWQMFLYISDGQGGWTQIQPREVRTNASGVANYTNLEPGVDHLVCEEQRDEWANSDPGNQAVMWDGKICQVVSGSNLVYGAVYPVLFGNYRLGEIIVVKRVVGDAPRDPWMFLFGRGDHDPRAFFLPPAGGQKEFEDLRAGEYHVAEVTKPLRYKLTGINCVDQNNNPVDVDPHRHGLKVGVHLGITESGQEITCTFTNVRKGRITIIKKVKGDPPPRPPFCPLCSAWWFKTNLPPFAFPLNPAGGQKTFDYVNPGQYTFKEITKPGYFPRVKCIDEASGNVVGTGTNQVSVNLGLNQHIICKFQNFEAGKITIEKIVIPRPQSWMGWGFNIHSDDNVGSGPVDKNLLVRTKPAYGSKTVMNLPPGIYDLSEALRPGYGMTVQCDTPFDLTSDGAQFKLKPGQHVKCTFVNKQEGRITITKATRPEGGQGFRFSAGPLGLFSLNDGQNWTRGVQPGQYTVTETGLPPGWRLDRITCTGGQVFNIPGGVRIPVGLGQHVRCTFHNVKLGKIIIHKQTRPNAQKEFNFKLEGGPPPELDQAFKLKNGQTFEQYVMPGQYSVTENVPARWILDEATCTGNNQPDSITVRPGETVECTFINIKKGKIIVKKVTDPENDPQAFNFTLTGPDGSTLSQNFILYDGDSYNSGFLPPDEGYSVAEQEVDGWELVDATCNNGSDPNNITVNPGQTVTCTFENEKQDDEPVTCIKLTKSLNGPFRWDGLLLSDRVIPYAAQIQNNGNWENLFYFDAVITVENCGTTELTNVQVTDLFSNEAQPINQSPLPPGVVITKSPASFLPFKPSSPPPPSPGIPFVPLGGTPSASGFEKETLTWTIGSIPGGQSRTLQFQIGTESNPNGLLEPTSAPQTIYYNGKDDSNSATVTADGNLSVSVGPMPLTNSSDQSCVGTVGEWSRLVFTAGPNTRPHDKCAAINTPPGGWPYTLTAQVAPPLP